MKRLVYLIVVMVVCLGSSFSYAFKIDTHVWIGQQIINDLEDDGKIAIKTGADTINIDINPEIKDAILNNKSAYLLGNIGPDAAPDVIAGQVFIHPGVQDENENYIGWTTDQWLKHLLNKSESSSTASAYTYGFLGHAASDVFAHTYVNQYAGGVFNLFDGEVLSEVRHFTLEGFIANYNPPLMNNEGQNLGEAWQVIEQDDRVARFVRDALIYDPEVKQEYEKGIAGIHMVAFHKLKREVNTLSNDEVWNDLDVWFTQVIFDYITGIELTDSQAQAVVDQGNQDLENFNEISRDLTNAVDNLLDGLAELDQSAFDQLTQDWNTIESKERQRLNKLQQARDELVKIVTPPSCPRIYIPPHCTHRPFRRPKCTSGGWKDDPVCNAKRDLVISRNDELNRLAKKLENEAFDLRSEVVSDLIDFRNDVNEQITALRTLHANLLEFFHDNTGNISGSRNYLKQWDADIDDAMVAYVNATQQLMVNTINPNINTDIDQTMKPLTDWLSCHGSGLLGQPTTLFGCETRDSIDKLKEGIEKILDFTAPPGTKMPQALEEKLEEIVAEEIDEIKEAIKQEVIDAIPDDIKALLALFKNGIDENTLNNVFTTDILDDPKNLIKIGDMATRVKAEMHLKDGKFNPEKFSVMNNAIVLSKLALLDAHGLEQLAKTLGANPSDYQPYVDNFKNIVAGAFANIDGNHQWMIKSPPLPRSFAEIVHNAYPDKFKDSFASDDGFVLWRNENLRNSIFRRIFTGPVSPGIDAPEVIGQEEILFASEDYPYKPCLEHPFPNGLDINGEIDKTCENLDKNRYARQWYGLAQIPGVDSAGILSDLVLRQNKSGQSVAVWNQTNGDLKDLYFSYYDGVNWSIAAKFADGTYSDTASNRRPINPRTEVAIDREGNFIVAWLVGDGGSQWRDGMKVRHFDAKQNNWNGAAINLIENKLVSSVSDESGFELSMQPNGDTVITTRNGYYYLTSYSYTADIGWTLDIPLFYSIDRPNTINTASNNVGQTLAVWGYGERSNQVNAYSIFDHATQQWRTHSEMPGGDIDSVNGDMGISFTDEGDATLAWTNRNGPDRRNYQALIKHYRNGVWLPVQERSSQGSWNPTGTIAMLDSAGHTLSLGRINNGVLKFKHYHGSSADSMTNELEIDRNIYDYDSYDMASDNQGNVIVLWRKKFNVYARHYSTSQGWSDNTETLSTVAMYRQKVRISMNDEGQAIASWFEKDNGVARIQTRRIGFATGHEGTPPISRH